MNPSMQLVFFFYLQIWRHRKAHFSEVQISEISVDSTLSSNATVILLGTLLLVVVNI